MRYLGRLLVYLAIFFFTLSVSSVLIARVIPVTVTPLKVLRLVENFPDKGLSVQSNWVPLHRINLSMVRAVIATEDNNFLTHRGFDWDAINRRSTRTAKGAASAEAAPYRNKPQRTFFASRRVPGRAKQSKPIIPS